MVSCQPNANPLVALQPSWSIACRWEQPFRFGHTAQRRYMSKYLKWRDELDTTLRSEYDGDYDADRADIRYAYGYKSKV